MLLVSVFKKKLHKHGLEYWFAMRTINTRSGNLRAVCNTIQNSKVLTLLTALWNPSELVPTGDVERDCVAFSVRCAVLLR